MHLEVADQRKPRDLLGADELSVLLRGLPSQRRWLNRAQKLEGARLVRKRHAKELCGLDLSHLLADDIAEVDVLQQVELAHLATRYLVHQHAVELGQHSDVAEDLVLTPLGFASTRLNASPKLGQVRRRLLEAVREEVPIVVDHLVQELLDIGSGVRGALKLHDATNLLQNRCMCYSDDARVPLPPISGAASDQGELVLTSADGTKFAGYFARAANPTGAGMVVMPDVRGLHQFYKELAQRFAEAGIDAVAIDYFGRTAGIGDRSDGFEYMPHVEKTTQEEMAKDVAAAIEYLKSQDGGAVKSVFTVGFCFGGSSSWNQSALQPGINGAVGFYGRPQRSESFISKMKAPLLLLLAGNDGATPQKAFHEFDKQLTEAKVPHEMHVYEGAPHSFFDRTFAQWKDASDDAWRRILAFVKQHG